MTGRLYAVGVGPGDPELLTRKAERILRGVQVIFAPTAGEAEASYALSIIEPFLDRERQQVLLRVFPMRRDQSGLDPFWEKAAADILDHLRAGRDVAFVTIGDPFLYSTYLYLHRIFRERHPEIEIEVVPGISSINAASAAAGVPLALADERIAVLPATCDEEEVVRALVHFDTVILLKVSRVFDRLYGMLKMLRLDGCGVFVRRVGSAQEEVVHDLSSLEGKDLDYLSLLIVRKR